MEELTKEIIERAERIGDEMKNVLEEMENQIKNRGILIKEKAEKLGYEIKKKIIR